MLRIRISFCQAEEKKRKENERRRRKLEQMRQRASDGNDHVAVDSDDEEDNLSVHEDSKDQKDPVSIKLTVYTENLNVSIPDSNSANIVSSLCETGRPTTLQANITIPETRSSRSNSVANSPVSDAGGTSKMDISMTQANLLVQGPKSSRSNSSVNSSTSDTTIGVSNGIPESDTIVNEVLVASNEPDIIRITKTRTPPSTLPYPPSAPHNTLTFPVAPPRKKKRSGSEVRILSN